MRISDWSSDVCSSDLQIGPSRCNERAGGPEMPRRGKVAAVGVARHARKISRRQRILAAAESGEARHPVGHRRPFAPVSGQIGRASGREGGCQTVWISGVAQSLKKKKTSMRIDMNY